MRFNVNETSGAEGKAFVTALLFFHFPCKLQFASQAILVSSVIVVVAVVVGMVNIVIVIVVFVTLVQSRPKLWRPFTNKLN